MVQPIDRDVADAEDWTLQVRRGETVSARVVIRRKEGFGGEVSFGKENSGRNASQGVYVDNIGLSGLLVLAGDIILLAFAYRLEDSRLIQVYKELTVALKEAIEPEI